MKTEGPPIPDRIELLPGLDALTIRRRWRSWRVVPLLLFVVAWDSFLVFWYSMALSGKGAPWIAIVFPIGHLAVGIGLTYFAIASLFNNTDVILSSSRVTVRTYPLPWPADRELSPGDIADTRVKPAGRTLNTDTYEIRYRTRANREKKLVGGGLTDDEAVFIEYHIRKTIGLADTD